MTPAATLHASSPSIATPRTKPGVVLVCVSQDEVIERVQVDCHQHGTNSSRDPDRWTIRRPPPIRVRERIGTCHRGAGRWRFRSLSPNHERSPARGMHVDPDNRRAAPSLTCGDPSMPALTVRSAVVEDAPHLAALNSVVQQLHHDAHPDRFLPPNRDAVEEVLTHWIDGSSARPDPEMRAWLCGDDREPIGYLIGVFRERPATPFTYAWRWIELDQIAVR